jgi:8-oxo-dGTP pyrophosphatase MutT (NUDIX family)
LNENERNIKSVKKQQMYEPVINTTRYYQPTKKFHIEVGKEKVRIVNKAFYSLSFRGSRGYPVASKAQTDQHKTYGAIICAEGSKYALVQGRYTGKWSFPKGHSNEGEMPIECTMREVGEETGIEVLPSPIEYTKIGYGNYYIFIIEKEIPLLPRDTNEIIDAKWVTVEEMEKMQLNADASLYRKKLLSMRDNK